MGDAFTSKGDVMHASACVLVILVLLPAIARGQPAPPPLPRMDVAVGTGWFIADRSIRGDSCCTMWSSSVFKGVSGGYYWTEHLKTEVEAAAPGPTEGYAVLSERLAANLVRYTSEEHRFTAGRLSISQAYQFGHNSTFHPFVRGGVDVDRERDEIERYVTVTNTFEEQLSVTHATRVRPFGGVGFKAYFNERAFFRGEARFTPSHGGIEQTVWTAGVGIDLGGRRRSTRPAADVPSASHSVPAGSSELVEEWRRYTAKLRIGQRVDVQTAGGTRLIADLVAVDDSSITVRPVVRIVEPARRIPFDQLERLALHTGPAPGTRVGAAIAGAGTGVGVFMTLLLLTFALVGD